jgi:putative aldouronate transport system substrate-binding protein
MTMLLICALVTTAFIGCSKKTENTPTPTQGATDATPTQGAAADTSKTYNGNDVNEPMVIKMYLLGDKSKDFDLVYSEINKILKETVNATVEVSFLSWAEHD